MDFILTKHAEEKMRLRKIPRGMLESVLNYPQQIVHEHDSMKAYQSLVDFGGGNMYLVRAIVDDSNIPMKVVTCYRTTHINKYWQRT